MISEWRRSQWRLVLGWIPASAGSGAKVRVAKSPLGWVQSRSREEQDFKHTESPYASGLWAFLRSGVSGARWKGAMGSQDSMNACVPELMLSLALPLPRPRVSAQDVANRGRE
jgi:hypothetical protein